MISEQKIRQHDVATVPVDNHLLLLGHPPAADFFHAIRTQVRGGEAMDAAQLTQEWRAASSRVRMLQEQEAGLAEHAGLEELPPQMRDEARRQMESPALQQGHRVTPRRWALVDIDRLMVFQKRINLAWISRIQQTLEHELSGTALVQLAAGHLLTPPAVQVIRSDDNTFTLMCRSGELRFFGTRALDPELWPHETLSGQVTHLIGAIVGFGLNCISAISFRNRLILTNGTHRVYALRERGLTQVPCLVTDIKHEDDFELSGVRDARPRFERYLRAPRPPLFKDYLDEQLRKIVPIPRSERAMQLQITCTSTRIPAPAEASD